MMIDKRERKREDAAKVCSQLKYAAKIWSQFKTSQRKKLVRPHLNKQDKCGYHTCNPSYVEYIEDHGSRSSQAKSIGPCLKNSLKKKGMEV
jgi:hypothetical protein